MNILQTIAWLVVALAAIPASAVVYMITPGDEANLVKFASKAPMESFEGKTDQVSGAIALDPVDLGDAFEMFVRVDLASLDTGIGLRNRHMRENHLHADQFPDAIFRGVTVLEGAGESLAVGETRALRVEGEFDLHGVVRKIQVPLELTLTPQGLRVVSRFPVTLKDHAIPRPGFLMMKLGETQQVSVDLLAPESAPTGSGETTD